MNHSQWRKLDPDQLPESAAIYAVVWRRKWLHLGAAENLKRTLDARPWPYRIALSLSDANLLWMPADDPRRQAAKLKRMLRCKWQCLDEGQALSTAPAVSDAALASDDAYPCCNWPSEKVTPAIPMVARPLANTTALSA